VRPNAKENGQIRQSNTARTVGKPSTLSHLGFQPVQKTPTIHVSSGFIWGIPIELAIIYCFVFLYLAAAGGGVWSLDHLRAGNKASRAALRT
jgi:hypothetical protein